MSTTDKPRIPFFDGDAFNQIVALLMTGIVILTALITYSYTLAEDAADDAGRDAQLFALQGLGKRSVGSIQASYDRTAAFQRWLELDTLARLAEQRSDTAGAERLRAARDRIIRLSPLLNPPYFDPQRDNTPAIAAYEADTYLVESIALTERFEERARVRAQWSERAGAYTVMLTLLAVTLFLLGISTGSSRRLRALLLAVGMALAAVVLLWLGLTSSEPINQMPDAAFDAYARGVGKFHQKNYPAAIEEFDRAVQLAPAYTNAYRDRGVTKYYAADYAGAAADFERALANGDVSNVTASGLGFLYYILGDFDGASTLQAAVFEDGGSEFWMRTNAALFLLAAGELDAGKKAYDDALALQTRLVSEARAQGKEPAASLWYEFDEAAKDVATLSNCALERDCQGAPPFDRLSQPQEIGRAAQAVAVKLAEYAVALEYTSRPPPAASDASVDEFVFTRVFAKDDQPIQAARTFTATDEPIYVLVPFRSLREGQQIVLKVLVDGYEDERLRLVADYSLTQMGGADADIFLAITTGGVPLSPGKYRVEMFVDSKQVRTGDFEVE